MRIRHLAVSSLLLSSTFVGCSPAPSNGSGPASTQATDGIHWMRYTDSAENAFSMDVPVGWQVQGGMYRFGYFDVRWMMEARSLDGKVILRIDDPSVPPYVLPGPHSGPAGHAAIRPRMFQMIVDDYREAQPYAANYARHRFGSVCKSMSERQSDWTPTLPQAWNPGAAPVKLTQGTVTYDCAASDGTRVVTVFARSTLLSQSNGLWTVDPILSIIAAPQQVKAAEAMVQHMIDSWQVNPQWKEYQNKMTQAGLQQIEAGFQQFMQQMQQYHQQREAAMNQQVSQYEARQNAQAAQVSEWGNILTGTTNLMDPATGTRFEAFSGPKANYYRNGAGVTINSNLPPGGGFSQVLDLGP